MSVLLECMIAAAPTVLSGIVMLKINKANKKADEVEHSRKERELLILRSLDANAAVSKELVRCVRGEKPNGELTEAFNYHQDVKHDLEDYMREKAADL